MATVAEPTQPSQRTGATPVGLARGGLMQWVRRHREFASALVFLVVMFGAFALASPGVFLKPQIYGAIFVSVPIAMVLAVSLVFVIVAGEIDLSFPSVVGVAAMVFTMVVTAGGNAWLALIAALASGVVCGLINGVLVAHLGLASLVATLGMNFLWRGFIQIVRQGNGAPLTFMANSDIHNVLVGRIGNLPVQLIWGLAFAAVAIVLFTRHRFGAHVCSVGDNIEASREMGINVRRVKVLAFAYVGLASGLAGVLSILVNNNFFPTVGDGYLLGVLAAVFVGGTPTWGGVGTVAGSVVGALTVGSIEAGIVAAGLTGYWTQFFDGIVIVLSLVTHRLTRPRTRVGRA
ncbi:MAG: ABC transporter permease [Chloroflexi bacterium]|nr:ABC transporter permease [Chloroflexota bacterium]